MPILSTLDIEIRVRYQETDGQGRVHHANFITYFEQGRTELLRASGRSYRQVEEEGLMLEHLYEVLRDEELLVRGRSVVACIDRDGRPRRVPEWLIPDDMQREGRKPRASHDAAE
jgi:acyl-CoA thioester hydrolase